MTSTVAELMTQIVVQMPGETTVIEAARAMRDRDIGDVVVIDGPTIAGVLTDRDIVVRGIAEGLDPVRSRIDELASADLVTVTREATVAEAADLMRERAVRRLLVTDDDGRLVGIVSVGDLGPRL